MKMKKRKLLTSAGLLLMLTFVLASVLNIAAINRVYSALQLRAMQMQATRITRHIRAELMEYAAWPWLFGYWEENCHRMDIPAEGFGDQDWLHRHEKYIGTDIKSITVSDAGSLPEEEQKSFAEVCYLECSELFDSMKKDFGLQNIHCTAKRADEEASGIYGFAFFQGIGEDTPDREYALGTIWPYHPELHPVAERIYETGTDLDDLENTTSTTDGKEYLFAYSPLTINGEVRYLICMTMLWSDVKNEIRTNAGKVGIIISLLLFVILILLLLLLYAAIIRPVSKLQKSVQRYKDEKDSLRESGQLERISCSGNEIGLLAADVSEMMMEIDRYVEEIRIQTSERERIHTELNMAAGIQKSVLPDSFPAFPGREDFDIYASMMPAREVGGDFYDFFLVDPDHLCLVMADVSGKGVPAALFMMISKSILANNARLINSPAKILENANAAICASNKMKMFVTVWLGILELSGGKLVAANAGHEYPAVCMDHNGFSTLSDKHGLVLGVREGRTYTEYELYLRPGDKIFVYTDGVSEAVNEHNEMFGMERLIDALNECADQSPEEIIRNVHRSVNIFAGDTEQFDDLTMLCVEYRGRR